jgi:hypothetical protein
MRAFVAALAALVGAAIPLELGDEPALAQGAGILDCYEHAQDRTLLDETTALALCDGANTSGPADCFVRARKETLLDTEDAITLCRCALATEPVDCYLRADKETFLDRSQRLRICSAVMMHRLLSDCTPFGGYYY